jgi:hypothetical protein
MTPVEHLRTKRVLEGTGTNIPDTPYSISIQHYAELRDRLTILTGWLIVMTLPLVQVIAMTFAGGTMLEVKMHHNRRQEANCTNNIHGNHSRCALAQCLKSQLII